MEPSYTLPTTEAASTTKPGEAPSPDMAVESAEHPLPKKPSAPTTCCLINHFNYGAFVGEAIQSVLAQTRELDEVIVVDDGSRPEDLAMLRSECAKSRRVTLVEKENGGQLSCFDAGLRASTSEVVFFLDADDAWEPEYVETVMNLMAERPKVDFVATNERRFFEDGTSETTERVDRDLGYSIVRSLSNGGSFIGQPTSCLAIRRSILDDIFPLDLVRGWRTCADEALVYGSSVVGARKYFLAAPLVRYRIHGNNHWFGTKYCPENRLLRGVEVLRLVEVLRTRQGLPCSLAHIAHHEFRTIERATKGDYREYWRLVASANLPLRRRFRILSALFAWHRLGRRI